MCNQPRSSLEKYKKLEKRYVDPVDVETGRVNVTILKRWANQTLAPSSTLREILLEENETMSVEEFLIKISTWLKLAHLEDQNTPNRYKKYG